MLSKTRVIPKRKKVVVGEPMSLTLTLTLPVRDCLTDNSKSSCGMPAVPTLKKESPSIVNECRFPASAWWPVR